MAGGNMLGNHHHHHGAGWHRHHHDHGAAGWPSLASHIGSGYLAERVYSGNLPLTTIMMSTMGLKKVKVAMTMAMTITMAMAMAMAEYDDCHDQSSG